jgi:hypothetical protein
MKLNPKKKCALLQQESGATDSQGTTVYLALLLTIFDVAYTSGSRQPLFVYWEFLAVYRGIVCVSTGWLHGHNKDARVRMILDASVSLAGFPGGDENRPLF